MGAPLNCHNGSGEAGVGQSDSIGSPQPGLHAEALSPIQSSMRPSPPTILWAESPTGLHAEGGPQCPTIYRQMQGVEFIVYMAGRQRPYFYMAPPTPTIIRQGRVHGDPLYLYGGEGHSPR
jgi:hypothetical protein